MAEIKIRTIGQRDLCASGATLREVSASVGVGTSTAKRWRDGTMVPNDDQARTLENEFQINANGWLQMADAGETFQARGRGRPTSKAKSARVEALQERAHEPAFEPPILNELGYPPPPAASATILEQLGYSLTCIRIDLHAGNLTTTTRSKLRSDESRTLALIAKMRREEELREDHYVKNHPAFLAHCEVILRALRPFPDAAKAVVEALRH